MSFSVNMRSSRHQYDPSFFDFISATALQSAQIVVPRMLQLLEVDSVIDFGCGRGAWLSVWRQMGIDAVVGVDAYCVDVERLMVDEGSFVAHDISVPIDMGRRFSLVQSLEVAEHIDSAFADTFIDNLDRHGDIILFSAALPGQCGIQHLNEQPFSYWRERFSRRGFTVLDPLRPGLVHCRDVKWWYRYGILLYVRNAVLPSLDEQLKRSAVADDVQIRDYSPTHLKWQRFIMRWMPTPLKEWCVRSYMDRNS